MNIKKTRTNETVIKGELLPDELKNLILDAVAKAAQVNLRQSGVDATVHYSQFAGGVVANVVITIDH